MGLNQSVQSQLAFLWKKRILNFLFILRFLLFQSLIYDQLGNHFQACPGGIYLLSKAIVNIALNSKLFYLHFRCTL